MTLPSSELIKDLFAEFGRTYYESEALCTGLGIFYALMSFKSATDITGPRMEEKMVEVSSLTLGQVIEKVLPLVTSDLQIRLKQGLEKRNYFAHSFWYERAYTLTTEAGIIEAIDELRQGRDMFEELDSEMEALLDRRSKEIGVTNEIVAVHFQRGLAGEVEAPLPSKARLSKKMIRIQEAYDIVLEDRKIALVFESDDGSFLQFCDVGLGWSNFTEVKPNWSINNELHQYLPASVVPRPEITDPWNYEFKLPQNVILWVKKGSTEKTFKWGIRVAKKSDSLQG